MEEHAKEIRLILRIGLTLLPGKIKKDFSGGVIGMMIKMPRVMARFLLKDKRDVCLYR
jgi:hypothetical protein